MSQKLIKALRGLTAVVLMLFATNFLPVLSAMQPHVGATAEKVFVCKYVGTPHVDERLQTGQNPIDVSVNAIQHNQWNGVVPGYFSDAHDRSYVLAYDIGQPTPNVSACPAPQGPTLIAPPTLHTDVVCGPSNDVTTLVNSADSAHYTVSHVGNTYTVTANSGFTFASGNPVTLTVPTDANTVCPDTVIAPPTLHTDVVCGPYNDLTVLVDSADSAHYTVSHVGNTYTVTAKTGFTFASGKTVTLNVPADTNTACPPTVIAPPTLHTDVVCGPSNDVTTLVNSADSAHYTVSHVGNTYTVTANSGFTFASGNPVTLTVPTDANTVCPPTEVALPPVPTITDLCGTGNATWNVPANTDQVKYILGSDGHLRVHTIFGFVFSDGSHSHDYGVATETNTKSCDEGGTVLGDLDVCLNIAGSQSSVPAGMTKDATTGNCVTTTVTGGQGGDVLGASTTASTELANTGQSPWAATVIGVTVIGLTLSSAFVSRKQRLEV